MQRDSAQFWVLMRELEEIFLASLRMKNFGQTDLSDITGYKGKNIGSLCRKADSASEPCLSHHQILR